jgi:ArsR family transcriptional regulator
VNASTRPGFHSVTRSTAVLVESTPRLVAPIPSPIRRPRIEYLAHAELSTGDVASRFEMSKQAVSQHLAVLKNAGTVASEKRGQFVFYRLVPDNLLNTLHTYAQEACPVSRPLKAGSAKLSTKNVQDAEQ